jgi:hypothetical protein
MDENRVGINLVLISPDGTFPVRKTLNEVAQEFDYRQTGWFQQIYFYGSLRMKREQK